MVQYKVAVLGLGAIFTRHLAALRANDKDFEFIAYYDPNQELVAKWQTELSKERCYPDESHAYTDPAVNCVVILTPSHLHFAQAKRALIHGKHVILEKPAAFSTYELDELGKLAREHQLNVFCVLQVRLNPSIAVAKKILDTGLLGEIRSAGLIQRWQRPPDYFSGWRGTNQGCGGVLNEFGIHYLDIMQYLLGVPTVVAAKFYQTKFKSSEVADSTYALFDFGSFGATMEICLSAEPCNIEVSLLIMGSQGFIKLGGKSLDQVIAAQFLTPELESSYEQICQDVLGYVIDDQVTIGACPHHPEFYKQIIHDQKRFNLDITYNVIGLITQINHLNGLNTTI